MRSDVSPTGKTGLSHADDDDDDVMMGMDDHTIRRLSACPGKPERAEPAISRKSGNWEGWTRTCLHGLGHPDLDKWEE